MLPATADDAASPAFEDQAPAAQPLEHLLAVIKSKPEFPAFADNIRELLNVLDNPYRPVFEISRVILRDVSLSTAVLRVVNSFYFQSHQQRQVHTVSSAVMLLGFNEIRDLAVGLKLLDHFKPSSSLNQVKKLTLLSFFMAMTAQELAKLNRRFDAEEIFLTALLFNFGELAAAYYFPEKYQKVLELNRTGEDKDAAFRQVFKVSAEELGQAVLQTWNLPQEFLQRLSELKKEDTEDNQPEKPLRRLFQGICKLSHLMFSGETSSEAWQRQEARLARSLGVEPKVLGQTLTACTGRLQEMARVLHLNLKSLGVKAPAEDKTPTLIIDSPCPAAPGGQAGEAHPAGGGQSLPPDLEAMRCRLQIMEEINQAIASQAPIYQILMMVLEGIWRGAGFERVAFCLVDRQRTQVAGRFGLGNGIEELLDYLATPLSDQGHALALALAQRQELLLDATVSSERRLLPWDLWSRGQVQLALLSPLVIDGKPVGVIYADRRPGAPRPSEADRQTVRTFRDLAVIALRQSAKRA